MSMKRAAIGFALSTAAAIVISAHAGQPVNLGIDMGLWELTTQAKVDGALPPQLQARLKSMPQAEQAQVQAAMQAAMAAAQRKRVLKECVTRARLSNAFDGGGDPGQCQSTLASNTRTEFDYHRVCTQKDGTKHTETAQFHMRDPHHIAGTVDVVGTDTGHKMTVHETVDGKWLGASCGSVKDPQIVK